MDTTVPSISLQMKPSFECCLTLHILISLFTYRQTRVGQLPDMHWHISASRKVSHFNDKLLIDVMIESLLCQNISHSDDIEVFSAVKRSAHLHDISYFKFSFVSMSQPLLFVCSRVCCIRHILFFEVKNSYFRVIYARALRFLSIKWPIDTATIPNNERCCCASNCWSEK